MIFAANEPKVIAVLDWELGTLGDPLADFTYVALAWVTENGGRSGVMDLDRKALGIPELDEVVARYCAATGRDGLPDLNLDILPITSSGWPASCKGSRSV